MITDHGCATSLRWAIRYRDLRAPRAKALEQRLGRMGGSCDCGLFLNGVTLDRRLRVPGTVSEGVRTGSTQRCTHWVRQRR